VPPTFINCEDFTSRPTRKSRNMTPRSARIRNTSFGAIQPSTYGPITIPARISPTMPGCPKRSNTSASSLAEANTSSIDSGISAAAAPVPARKKAMHYYPAASPAVY
jgi:hypothetical protein